MNSPDWKQILARHPLFSDLGAGDLERLLDSSMSIVREFSADSSIVREGEVSDSVFLIGHGSVDITLTSADGEKIILRSLRSGEMFGEMALFERRPRSATATATEPSALLEIKGQNFLDLLREHPEIEFRVLLKLSERLRSLGEEILAIRLKNVDETIRLLDRKLDAELKVVDASLRASEAVFDQTSKRANEIIDSADRSRSRLTVAASTTVGVITIVIAVFGFLGVQELRSVRAIEERAGEAEKRIDGHKRHIDQLVAELPDPAEVEAAIAQLEKWQRLRPMFLGTLVDEFQRVMRDGNYGDAKALFETIAGENDPEVSRRLFQVVYADLRRGPEYREKYGDLLRSQENAATSGAISDYLLLITLIWNGDSETEAFHQTLERFKRNVAPDRGVLRKYFAPGLFLDQLEESDGELLSNIWREVVGG